MTTATQSLVRATIISLAAILCSSVSAASVDSKASFEAHKKAVLAESSLIRYYTFEEGEGEEVRNAVDLEPGRLAMSGGPLGSLYILRDSPYGVTRQHYINIPSTDPSPRWTTGRWPWKAALTSGLQKRCVFRSGVSDELKHLTFEAWFRPHVGSGKDQCSLFNIALGHYSGMIVRYSQNGKGTISLCLGAKTGSAFVYAGGFPPGVWHHLVCTYDGNTLKIYRNGELVGSKAYEGGYIPPANVDGNTYKPFLESRGDYLQIGGRPSTRDGDARFDIGELAVYNSAINEDTIKAHAASGAPGATPEEQLAAYTSLQEQIARTDQITIAIPHDTWGYFTRKTTIPLTVSFPQASGYTGTFQISSRVSDQKGSTLWEKDDTIQLNDQGAATRTTEVPGLEAGIAFLDVRITDSKGNLIKRLPEPYGLGITAPPPAQDDVSLLNPLGIQASLEPHLHRVMPFYRQFIHWGSLLNEEKAQLSIDKHMALAESIKVNGPQFPAMILCLSFDHHRYKTIGAKEEAEIRQGITRAVQEFKGTAAYWEVSNEPNGKFSPTTYMKILTICAEIIRQETPDIKILAPGASPSGLPFINKILEMGAADYIDIVTFHNYVGQPIHQYRWSNTAHELQAIIKKHTDKPLPIWNGESGIFSLPRVGQTSMTYDAARRVGFKPLASGKAFATSMPTFPERRAAAYQVQAIVLDLASGYERYIKCQSPSLPGMEGVNTLASPTLPGITISGLSTVLNEMTAIHELPLGSLDDFCAMVTSQDGSHTAIAFSDKTPALTFRVGPGRTINGMDMLGKPLTWQAEENGLIVVQLSEDPIYMFDVPATFKQITPLAVSCPEKLAENQTLTGTVTVSNPFDTELSGSLVAEPLPGATITFAKPTVTLAPGASITGDFTLVATHLRRRPYRLSIELKTADKTLAAASAMFQSPGTITMIPQVTHNITLDGDASDWKGIPSDTADGEEYVVHGKPNLAELWLPQWRGQDDLSFTAQYVWRKNDAVYLLIQVTDDTVMPTPKGNEGRAFQWDCLELFFDSRPYGTRSGPVSDGADQVIVIPSAADRAEACTLWYAAKDDAYIKAEFVGRKSAAGYVLEGKIVPKANSDLRVLAGSQFCMDLFFDDIDDPDKLRKAAMALHGIFNNYTDSSMWGRYQLDPMK